MPFHDVKPPEKQHSPQDRSNLQAQSKNQKARFKFSKPILFILLLAVVLIGITAYLLLKSEPDPAPLKDAAARAQEIARVSQLVKQQSSDQNAEALASTIISTMSSQESGLSKYLKNNGFQVSKSELSSYYDNSTDEKLTTAAQNKQLEVTYYDYLHTKILAYRTALKISTGEVNQKGKDLINSYLTKTNSLLNTPQLQTSTQ
jgi:hypothetical protein